MKESYNEELANHIGLKPYAVDGNIGGVASVRGNAGQLLNSEILAKQGQQLRPPRPIQRRLHLASKLKPQLILAVACCNYLFEGFDVGEEEFALWLEDAAYSSLAALEEFPFCVGTVVRVKTLYCRGIG